MAGGLDNLSEGQVDVSKQCQLLMSGGEGESLMIVAPDVATCLSPQSIAAKVEINSLADSVR